MFNMQQVINFIEISLWNLAVSRCVQIDTSHHSPQFTSHVSMVYLVAPGQSIQVKMSCSNAPHQTDLLDTRWHSTNAIMPPCITVYLTSYFILSYDFASGSEITSCIIW